MILQRMRLRWISHWPVLASVAMVFLSLTGIHIEIRHRELVRANRELLAARRYPYLLTGLRLDLLDGTDVAEHAPYAAFEEIRRRLLIALDDRCKACDKVLPDIQELLSRVHWQPDQEVLILSFSGTSLAAAISKQLAARRVQYRVLHVKDSPSFTCATGVVSVPFLAVLSREYDLTALALNPVPDALARLQYVLERNDSQSGK
jgi:hypothetical protein